MNVRVVLLPEGDDPDSFARAHSAAEVQEYIAKNAENFITFKANLLLSETDNDPIKRSEVTRNMITSIAQIPDTVKRSEFIKECAKLMNVDENMLISEVARYRMMSLGDSEAEAFIRRQQQQTRRESGGYNNYYNRQQQPTTNSEEATQRFGETPLVASRQTLEREIVYYLLKYGDHKYEIMESGTILEMNVANEIIRQLDGDGLSFSDPTYSTILDIYRQALAEGRFPHQVEIVNHADPAVCSVAVDILTMDDNYTESAIWSQKDMRSLNESDMLATGIPKLLWLYKSKTVMGRIAELHAALENNPSEDQVLEIMQELNNMNKLKVALSNHLKRLII
jgi:DNA primase